MLVWKGVARYKRVDFYKWVLYDPAIRSCIDGDAEDYLDRLCKLRGIKSRVASTLLHFMYPARLPIIDIRTVRVLHSAGIFQFERTDRKAYSPQTYQFLKTVMLDLHSATGKTLTEIDRALFAYDKKVNGPLKAKRQKGE